VLLERRIEKIERANRNLRLIVLCLAVGLGVSVWLRAEPNDLNWQAAATAAEFQDAVPVQKLVRARKIELVGDKGQVLISFQGTKRGNVFTFNDQGKRMVVLSGTSDGQGAIATYDPKYDKVLVAIAANRSDGNVVTKDAKTGHTLVSIGSDGSRGGGVNSYDRNGTQYDHVRRRVN